MGLGVLKTHEVRKDGNRMRTLQRIKHELP
jgi:hypothetical protein